MYFGVCLFTLMIYIYISLIITYVYVYIYTNRPTSSIYILAYMWQTIDRLCHN